MAANFGGGLFMGIMTSFLRYTGYTNFIKDHINHIIFLILVHVLPHLTYCLTRIKTMLLNIVKSLREEW